MKVQILALLLSCVSLVAMEDPRQGKRAAPDEELQGQSKEPRLAPVQANMYAFNSLPGLPTDIQKILMGYLLDAAGDTLEEQFFNAAQNIRNFLMVNKRYKPLLDDPILAGLIISVLAQVYTNNDVVKAALALNTNAASIWLAAQVANAKFFVTPHKVIVEPQALQGQLFKDQLQAALNYAVANDRIDILRFLVTYSPILANWPVDVTVDNDIDLLPILEAALTQENVALIQLLLKAGAKITDPIVMSVAANVSPFALDQLRVAGIDLRKMFEGESLLSFATSGKMIDYLIAHGLNLNSQNKQGNTPLARAILEYDPQKMKLLLQRNVPLPEKVYARQDDGTVIASSPLAFLLRVPLYARPQILIRMLYLLTEYGANVNEIVTDPTTGVPVTLLTYLKKQPQSTMMSVIINYLMAHGAHE